jgi:hypothetical protein
MLASPVFGDPPQQEPAMTDEKKNEQTANSESARKVDELPPKQVSDADAQSVKGGMTSLKFDKK